MSKKDNKELENTKVTGTFVVETDHGIVTNIAYSTIMQPNVKFSGKPMKWFDVKEELKRKAVIFERYSFKQHNIRDGKI